MEKKLSGEREPEVKGVKIGSALGYCYDRPKST
jgi:hypothetical protein